jgi:hypothetical protein
MGNPATLTAQGDAAQLLPILIVPHEKTPRLPEVYGQLRIPGEVARESAMMSPSIPI